MSHIRAENLVVDFPIYGAKGRSFKNTVMRAATGGLLARSTDDRLFVRALNGISFDLSEGDRVGLVGHNGSGKSTLLRVIAGAYEPVSGSLHVAGRVASMLGITLGMDHEATGFENIYIRAALMGLSKKRVDPLLHDIVDFTELGDYLDMPIRTYSSGMFMRLAFAVSTCMPADIILMDEWLSVGDASFSEKAQDRLQRMLEKAQIMVLASHDEGLLRRSCNKIMRLNHGSLEAFTRI